MKAILFALAVFVAGSAALPQTDSLAVEKASDRIIDGVIITVIEDLLQRIRERGLDPFYRAFVAGSYSLPVPRLFNTAGSASDVSLVGLSNVNINSVTYNVLTGFISVDLSLVHLRGSVSDAEGQVTLFERTVTGTGSGSISVSELRVAGSGRVSISVVNGVTVSDVATSITLGGVQSDVKLNIHTYDLSDHVNDFLNDTVPKGLEEYGSEIGELLAIIIERYLNSML